MYRQRVFAFLGGGAGAGGVGGGGEYVYTGAGMETDDDDYDEEEEGEEDDDDEEEDIFYASVPPSSAVELPPLHTHSQRHTLDAREAIESKANGALLVAAPTMSVVEGKDEKTEGGEGHLLDSEKEKESSKPIINEDDFIPHECVICMDEFTLENPEMHTRKFIECLCLCIYVRLCMRKAIIAR